MYRVQSALASWAARLAAAANRVSFCTDCGGWGLAAARPPRFCPHCYGWGLALRQRRA